MSTRCEGIPTPDGRRASCVVWQREGACPHVPKEAWLHRPPMHHEIAWPVADRDLGVVQDRLDVVRDAVVEVFGAELRLKAIDDGLSIALGNSEPVHILTGPDEDFEAVDWMDIVTDLQHRRYHASLHQPGSHARMVAIVSGQVVFLLDREGAS